MYTAKMARDRSLEVRLSRERGYVEPLIEAAADDGLQEVNVNINEDEYIKELITNGFEVNTTNNDEGATIEINISWY